MTSNRQAPTTGPGNRPGPVRHDAPQQPKQNRIVTVTMTIVVVVLLVGAVCLCFAFAVDGYPGQGTLSLPSGAPTIHPVPGSSPTTTQTPSPSPSAEPPHGVDQGVPTSIVVRRGSVRIVPTTEISVGGPEAPPSGLNWVQGSSKVGTNMGTAVILGHRQTGMPFDGLERVLQGDTIEVTVPKGKVSFVVGGVTNVGAKIHVDPSATDTLEVVILCGCQRNIGRVIHGRISS